MKLFLLLFFFLLATEGCDYRNREETIRQREASLNEKEQELLLKEKSLQLKEQELLQKQRAIDSTVAAADTTARYHPGLVGSWNVQMTCSETTCTGSAVGDTKTETWTLLYQDKNLIARAMVNEELVRVYSGIFTGNTIELVEAHEATTPPVTKMIVQLTIVNDKKLEGQRIIERLNEDCRIVYTMTMDKK